MKRFMDPYIAAAERRDAASGRPNNHPSNEVIEDEEGNRYLRLSDGSVYNERSGRFEQRRPDYW